VIQWVWGRGVHLFSVWGMESRALPC
jgi:hypothetical protein